MPSDGLERAIHEADLLERLALIKCFVFYAFDTSRNGDFLEARLPEAFSRDGFESLVQQHMFERYTPTEQFIS